MTSVFKSFSSRLRATGARFGIDKRGMAAIEFAFILPFMLLIYFGVLDIGSLLSANRKVTLAASALGDLVAQAPGTISTGDLTGIYAAVTPIMDPIPASQVKIQILTYKKNGTGTTLRWQNSLNGGCAGTLPTGMAGMMADGNDLVIARVCTNFTALTGQVVGATAFSLSDQFVLRPREAPELVCSNC